MTSIDDYKNFIVHPDCIRDPLLQGAKVKMLPDGFPWRAVGGFCVVFHLTAKNGKQYAVRCWHSDIELAQQRCREVSKKIHEADLPYFVHFDYVDKALVVNGGLASFVRMEWVEALNLKDYIIAHKGNPSRLAKLAGAFYKMCCDLHRKKLSHGDLHHDNIMVKANGDIILLDYDSVYHPSMGKVSALVQGKRDYQHPSRKNAIYASAHIDAFSELIIYTSLLYLAENPSAINDQLKSSDYLVFSTNDYENFRTSKIYKKLTSHSPTLAFWTEQIAKSLSIKSLEDLPNLEEIKRRSEKKKRLSWQAQTKLWIKQQREQPNMNRVAFILSCLVAYGLFVAALRSSQSFFAHQQLTYQVIAIVIYILFFFSLAYITIERLRNIGLRFQYRVYIIALLCYGIFYLALTMIDNSIGDTPFFTTLAILSLACVLIPPRCISILK